MTIENERLIAIIKVKKVGRELVGGSGSYASEKKTQPFDEELLSFTVQAKTETSLRLKVQAIMETLEEA